MEMVTEKVFEVRRKAVFSKDMKKRYELKDGYIAIILKPIQDDCSDIMEELNLDYTLVDVPDNNYYQIDVKGKKHHMKKKRRWNSYDIVLSENRGKVYVIYSMKIKRLRELGVI